MSFLPISVLAYALNAGSIVIDKILLQKSVPNPIAYAFFISVLGLLVLLLIPFGFTIPGTNALIFSALSGIVFAIALFSMFTSLKYQEASVVGPVVGALNPLFTLIIGYLFFSQTLAGNQMLAILILIFGAIVIAIDFRNSKFQFNKYLLWMAAAGLFFALSYIFLRQAFLETSFLNGLIVSRVAGGIFALAFLLFPNSRAQILAHQKTSSQKQTIITFILLLCGQSMGAVQGLLITYAVSLADPALVNSLFGVQYVVILIVAILLYRKNPHLLDERLSKNVITQKIIGVLILSVGLYLLAK